MVEHWTADPVVPGSNPGVSYFFKMLFLFFFLLFECSSSPHFPRLFLFGWLVFAVCLLVGWCFVVCVLPLCLFVVLIVFVGCCLFY